MRQNKRLLSGVLVAGLVLGGVAAIFAAPLTGGAGNIKGVVLDEKNEPVRGVSVFLFRPVDLKQLKDQKDLRVVKFWGYEDSVVLKRGGGGGGEGNEERQDRREDIKDKREDRREDIKDKREDKREDNPRGGNPGGGGWNPGRGGGNPGVGGGNPGGGWNGGVWGGGKGKPGIQRKLGPVAEAETGIMGTFAWSAVPAGDYDLLFKAKGQQNAFYSVKVEVGKTTQVKVTLHPKKVTEDSNPAEEPVK